MSKFQPQATTFAFLCFGVLDQPVYRGRVDHISYIIWIHFDHFWQFLTCIHFPDLSGPGVRECGETIVGLTVGCSISWGGHLGTFFTLEKCWTLNTCWCYLMLFFLHPTVDWCQYSCLNLLFIVMDVIAFTQVRDPLQSLLEEVTWMHCLDSSFCRQHFQFLCRHVFVQIFVSLLLNQFNKKKTRLCVQCTKNSNYLSLFSQLLSR